MIERKKQILELINECLNIIEVFGIEFLKDAIESFAVEKGVQWSGRNYFIANYLMSASFYRGQSNFITEFENILHYFFKNHPNYIKSASVLSGLKSKDEPTFQGKWSELIFTYYLNKCNIEIFNISKMLKTENGEVELYDINSSIGEIEVTTIVSKKGIIDDTNDVFWGSIEISNTDKTLINNKIKRKKGKKLIAIDCTFVDDLSSKIVESYSGITIDFKVFKKTSKNMILFVRNPQTQQVGICKILNR